MDFFEQNWDYIQSNARAKAVEIAEKTGFMADIDDFKQDILLFVATRAHRFDPERAQANTFIEVCMTSAKKNIIRNIYRRRRRTIIDTVEIEPRYDNDNDNNAICENNRERAEEIAEFIHALDEPEKTICAELIIHGVPAGRIGRTRHMSKQGVIAVATKAMRPLAASFGIGVGRTALLIDGNEGNGDEGGK